MNPFRRLPNTRNWKNINDRINIVFPSLRLKEGSLAARKSTFSPRAQEDPLCEQAFTRKPQLSLRWTVLAGSLMFLLQFGMWLRLRPVMENTPPCCELPLLRSTSNAFQISVPVYACQEERECALFYLQAAACACCGHLGPAQHSDSQLTLIKT